MYDPPLEQLVDHRVRRAELLEHGGVGRVAGLRLLALRQVELEEQDLLELLRAAEVELVPDVVVDLLLEPGDLGRELAFEHAERLAIERDADGLHPGEHRDQRQLDLAEQPLELDLAEPSSSGSRTAIADSASSPARAVAGSSAGGGRIWSSVSATTSAIVWLRSAALRM